MNADIIGWIGTFFFVVGSLAIIYKWRSGFVHMLAGNISFVIVGLLTDLPSLSVVSAFMGLLDVFGWIKWGKK